MARPDFAQASVPLERAQSTIQRLLDEGDLPEGAQSALQGVQQNIREAKEQVELGDILNPAKPPYERPGPPPVENA